MRKPSTIKILGREIKIKYVAAMPDPDLLGTYCHEESVITVVKNSEWLGTLLHEAVHACLIVSGVSQLMTNETHEAVVVCLENGLKDHFRVKYKKNG